MVCAVIFQAFAVNNSVFDFVSDFVSSFLQDETVKKG
jgi:hypothetical protein